MSKNRYLVITSLISIATCILPPNAAIANTVSESSAEVDEIIITGTRIQREGYSAPVPLTVVGREEISTSGTPSLIDVLNEMPAIAPGLDSSNGSNNLDGGSAFINLRGLGTNRSLTLVNGRRRVSGSATSSAVDLNTIPAAAVERVEITTGGGSAIYGADAVSGVVNIITRKNFNGLEVSAQGGMSEEGDAERYSLNMFGGTHFADNRGQVNFGLSYSRTEQLLNRERSYLINRLSWQGTPGNTNGTDGIPDLSIFPNVHGVQQSIYPVFHIGGENYIYTQSGLITPVAETVFATGIRGSGSNWTKEAGIFDGGREHAAQLGNQVLSMRSDLSYELTDSVNFFVEGEFTRTKTPVVNQFFRFDHRPVWFQQTGGPVIGLDSYYLPEALRDVMVQAGIDSVPVARRLPQELGIITDHHDRRTFSVVLGLEGRLFDDWNWDLSYQYGQAHDDIETPNLLRNPNFKNAVDTIADPVTGLPVCRDAEARAAGCVAYNIFASGPLTEEQRAYMVGNRLQYTRNTQQVLAAHLGGDVFNLPAGPVTLALGAEHREEGLKTQDDHGMISGHIRWGVGTNATPRETLDKKFKVTETYGEVVVPLLHDIRFIQALDINGAVRISDYNTIGSTFTWQGGANWTINDDIRLRVTRSRSVRAPNLLELYAPTSITLTSIANPCGPSTISTTQNRLDNCVALGNVPAGGLVSIPEIDAISGGNADAQEETSNSFTAGAVFTPRFAPGLRMSIDYYKIDIKDALTVFGSSAIFKACLDSSQMAGNMFCETMDFDANGNLTALRTVLMNASKYTNSGLDLAVDYRMPIGNQGQLGLSLIGNYLLKKEFLGILDDPATLSVETGEYHSPRLRFNLAVSYDQPTWGVTVKNRFIGSAVIDKQATPERYSDQSVKAKVYTDLVVRAAFTEKLNGFVGVNNALNIRPQKLPETSRYGTYYDLIGRYFHAGIKAQF